MELVLILVMTIVGLIYVGYPLFTDEERWKKLPKKTPSRGDELKARKDLALSAIKELEFDFQTGKLSPEDYSSLRSRYEAEAVEAMKALDGIQKGGKKFKTKKGAEGKLICSSCGEEVPSSSRYCSNCGTRFSPSG